MCSVLGHRAFVHHVNVVCRRHIGKAVADQNVRFFCVVTDYAKIDRFRFVETCRFLLAKVINFDTNEHPCRKGGAFFRLLGPGLEGCAG